MTENTKKATKKEVADETPINEVQIQKTDENGEKQDVITENLTSEEVVSVTAEDLPEEKVSETKAEDYGFADGRKEKGT